MQRKNIELLIEQSHAHDNAIAAAVRQATEVGVVVPSLLRAALEKAQLRINEDEAEHARDGYCQLKNMYRVLIHNADGAVIAMGASDSAADALLHAVLGFLRERDIELLGFIVPLEFHQVDPAKINKIGLNGQQLPDQTVAAVKTYLTKKNAAKAERAGN